MKNPQKFFALALILTLVVGCFAGCASQSGTSEPAASTAPQTETPDRAHEILAGMTDVEKVCQLFIWRVDRLAGRTDFTQGESFSGDPAILAEKLEKYPLGGVILFPGNMTSEEQTKTLLQTLQDASKIDMIICTDEEGGRVNRVAPALGYEKREAMFTYRTQGTEIAYENAAYIGGYLAPLGINTDLAPVADVWTNPANTVIGDRAYSDDPETVSQLITAAIEGYHSQGIMTAIKHFPGHGDTEADTHKQAAYSDKTLEELEEVEFLPFRAGIAAGTNLVMTSHVTLTAIDEKPATLSHAVVTGLLRERLGYNGVVITDGLTLMAALEDYTIEEVVVEALLAGHDILLDPENLDVAIEAILAGVPMERIEESVLRILNLKLDNGVIE
jgi:beta-N-acetylhexosaminidase